MGNVRLRPGVFKTRYDLNRQYVFSLKNANLLQNYYQEAGMWNPRFRQTDMGEARRGDDIHWGWESPTCQLRGHFLGHWLSAASYMAAWSPSDVAVMPSDVHVTSEAAVLPSSWALAVTLSPPDAVVARPRRQCRPTTQ